MYIKYAALFVCLFGLWWLTSCGSKKVDERMISVTIEPERYFGQKIAGDKYKFNCVVPSGQSPETYDPTPKEMIKIGQSIAYFRIGTIGFEQLWMEKIKENNPELKIFDTSIGMRLIKNEEHPHAQEEDCTHHHGLTDPHIWNSIEGAKVISWNILNALIELDPENTKYYWENYNKLMDEIEQTEKQLSDLLRPLNGTAFIIYHPALTYLAEEFGLKQLSIELDGKEPSPATLKDLVEMAKKENARVAFIQKEFDQRNAELIAKETGCKLVSINPLSFDWKDEMLNIAKSLSKYGRAD
jgi:zinc transport system substrate-binding protein